VRGCRDVSIFEEGDELVLLPSVNQGARLGFSVMENLAIRSSKASAKVLGEDVLRALALSTSSDLPS